jgi:flagellar motor switch protein FliG
MDRERQTLELLQLLGDEVAESVLARLQPDRAAKLRAGLKADVPIISTMSRQREVLDEFECFFQFATKSLASGTLDSSPSASGAPEPFDDSRQVQPHSAGMSSSLPMVGADTPVVGTDSADATSTRNTAPGGSESISEDITADSGNTDEGQEQEQEDSMAASQTVQASPQVELTGDPMQDLQLLSVHQLAQALGSEQARTTAILLSHLPARLTGDVLNLLKPDYQKLVMIELTKEQHAPAVLVERIARATVARARQLPAEPPDTRDHADRIAEVLRSVPKAGRRNMLAAIEEQDPELARSLLTRIYRFDDIVGLNKTVVQRILGEIDSVNLTTALYGAADEIRDAIFANLSKRARQTIEEEMQFMTSVAESRIQQARNSIAEIIAKIDMESES